MCTQIPSDMGAEVLKIENPGRRRRHTRGRCRGRRRPQAKAISSWPSIAARRHRLDFTKPEGRAIVHKLLEGRRHGPEFPAKVLAKYGLD